MVDAFDKRSGALLRQFEIDGFSAAPPMSYTYGGKQYLVMAVGANEEAAIVAFGLPETRRGLLGQSDQPPSDRHSRPKHDRGECHGLQPEWADSH